MSWGAETVRLQIHSAVAKTPRPTPSGRDVGNPTSRTPKEVLMIKLRAARRLIVALALGGIALVAACTPEQAVAVQQAIREGDTFYHVVSDEGLARLRSCESGGNYNIVSKSGAYRGAYQFNRGTWDGVAARHYPHLVGVDPAAAFTFEQDRMARALWHERGPQPWPVCGRRV